SHRDHFRFRHLARLDAELPAVPRTADDVPREESLAEIAPHVGALILDRVHLAAAKEEGDLDTLHGDDVASPLLEPRELRGVYESRQAASSNPQTKPGAPFRSAGQSSLRGCLGLVVRWDQPGALVAPAAPA